MDYFKAKILKIIPDAVYRGITYTQEVLIELKNSQRLILFDQYGVKEEMVGQGTRVRALIFANSPKKSPKCEQLLVTREDRAVKIAGKISEIKPLELGRITREAVLDIGCANFLFDCASGMKVGDCVIFDVEKEKNQPYKNYRIDLRPASLDSRKH